ncbi:MAG: YigZ family protein, partial [Victivallales bacterium]|nr:YigZ family protein [Victivallales bacterium]
MLVLEESVQFELTVKNSRFLAEAFIVGNAEAARERLREQKERFSDASHVVHAFIVGPEGNVMGCSDDGEPSGTSGRPVLEVLKGSGVTNVILTVTRWFGGTKLGTGGLVKAYTESAQGVVAQMRTHELVAMSHFEMMVPYGLYE